MNRVPCFWYSLVQISVWLYPVCFLAEVYYYVQRWLVMDHDYAPTTIGVGLLITVRFIFESWLRLDWRRYCLQIMLVSEAYLTLCHFSIIEENLKILMKHNAKCAWVLGLFRWIWHNCQCPLSFFLYYLKFSLYVDISFHICWMINTPLCLQSWKINVALRSFFKLILKIVCHLSDFAIVSISCPYMVKL